MDESDTVIEAKHLSKYYDDGLTVGLENVSLVLEKGKIYALMGSSGSGKSTLLNILGTLDDSDKGTIQYFGRGIETFGSINRFRREYIGFIFQFHYLIPILTLCENVESAILFKKNLSVSEIRSKSQKLLHDFGLKEKYHALASNVSGGERQRAAIARALANDPKIILADEPTGNIDSETTNIVMEVLCQYVKKENATILIATHDTIVGEFADEVIHISDGRIK